MKRWLLIFLLMVLVGTGFLLATIAVATAVSRASVCVAEPPVLHDSADPWRPQAERPTHR